MVRCQWCQKVRGQWGRDSDWVAMASAVIPLAPPLSASMTWAHARVQTQRGHIGGNYLLSQWTATCRNIIYTCSATAGYLNQFCSFAIKALTNMHIGNFQNACSATGNRIASMTPEMIICAMNPRTFAVELARQLPTTTHHVSAYGSWACTRLTGKKNLSCTYTCRAILTRKFPWYLILFFFKV